ncbi:hypothetical protein KKF91_14770 [Myxococcota bacterium]|nr:hypothetical protein [Myxococcota bacterium]MBU1431802.1 hypothetical protein [Myxococcota bacterium]
MRTRPPPRRLDPLASLALIGLAALLAIPLGCDDDPQPRFIKDASMDAPFETDDGGLACAEDEDCADDGDLCNGAPACVEGACVDDPSRAVACPPPSAPCLEAACTPSTGACVEIPVADGQGCDDQDACTEGDRCEGGRCVGDLVCACRAPADCAAADDRDLCNGVLTCVEGACVVDPATVITCPTPEGQCEVARCAPETGDCLVEPALNGLPCDDDDPCSAPDACQGGLCVPGPPQCGCTDDAACAALDDDDLCNGVFRCVNGACAHDPASVVRCPAPADPCLAVFCLPSTGLCQSAPIADGAICEDGDLCTRPDVCQGGRCVSGADDCQCRDDLDCAALDDADLCNGRLSCQGGRCALDPDTIITCRPPDAPCQAARCEPSSGACVQEAIEGACQDGNPCTAPDVCAAGACVGGPDICGDCAADADCAAMDDADLCNGRLVCRDAACVLDPASVVTCPALGDPCLINVCVPQTGQCAPAPNDGQACDDQEPCTQPDTCASGACRAGAWICECRVDGDCAPADPCLGAAVCLAGACALDPSSAPHCDPGFICAQGACERDDLSCAWGCDDGDVCTGDRCDEALDRCAHDPLSDTPCALDVCTEGATCQAGVCQGGQPLSCLDEDPQTAERCAPGVGCVYPPPNDACIASTPFTLGAPTPQASLDLIVRDLSDTQASLCEAAPSPEVFYTLTLAERGGVSLNVVDLPPEQMAPRLTLSQGPCDAPDAPRCLALADLIVLEPGEYTLVVDLDPATPEGFYTLDARWVPPCQALDCDDDNACTDDACDEGLGDCVHPPIADATPCDTDRCFNGQTCLGGACQGGDPLVCEDNDPSTANLCEPASGCRFPPLNDTCEGIIELRPDPAVEVTVDLSDATSDYTLSCEAGINDAVYGLDIVGPRVVSVNAAQNNAIFSLREGDCGAEIACGHGRLDQAVGAGRYSLIVSRERPVTFTVELLDPCAALDCDDHEVCTDDRCDPNEARCVNTPRADGEACALEACLVDQVCAAGVCQGGAARICEDPNPDLVGACLPEVGCVFTHINDRCPAAINLDPVGTHHFEGDASSATLDSALGVPCGGDAPDVFYRFVLPAEELVRVDLNAEAGGAVALLSPNCEATQDNRCVDERTISTVTLPAGAHILAVKTTGAFSLDLTFGCADEVNQPVQLPINEPLMLVAVPGADDSFYLPALCEGGLFVAEAVFDAQRGPIALSLSAECGGMDCPSEPLALGTSTERGERVVLDSSNPLWDHILTISTNGNCNPYELYAELFCPGDSEVCLGDLDEDRDGLVACADSDCSGQVVQEGLCTNDDDAQIFSENNFVLTGIDCVDVCNGDLECVQLCLSQNTGLSMSCTSCITPTLECAASRCFIACTQTTEICVACAQVQCLDILHQCTGVICVQESICNDNLDDDLDGLLDCNDPDCATWCSQEHICDDGIDNEGDGLSDCNDPDCAGVGICP